MSLLLDTHALLWLCQGNRRLGVRALAAHPCGRLRQHHRDRGDRHQGGGALPRHHDDPFDRALVAQARSEPLVLVTADPAMQAYDVALLDATR